MAWRAARPDRNTPGAARRVPPGAEARHRRTFLISLDHPVVQTRFLGLSNESLGPWIQILRTGREPPRLDAGNLQHGSKRVAALPITINDHESSVADEDQGRT